MEKTILQYTGKTLEFIQPSVFKKHYLLQYEEEQVARLDLPRTFSMNAVFSLFDKKWEIKQISFWKSTFGIYKFGYELPYAQYKGNLFGKGLIELPKGVKLKVNVGLWKGITNVYEKESKILFSVNSKSGLKEKLLISIPGSNELLHEYPWLIILICYLSIIRRHTASM